MVIHKDDTFCQGDQEMNQDLYSGLKNVTIYDVKENNGLLEVILKSNLSSVSCPACKNPSSSVKQSRIHRLIDKPYSNIPVSLFIIKRQFKCNYSGCQTKSFTEEIEGLKKKHIYTNNFKNFLADLFDHMDYPTLYKHLAKFNLNIPASTISYKLKDEPINFQISLQDVQNAKYIGLDEFSYSKGNSFGVICVNIDKHKIADMVAGGRNQKTAEAAISIFNPATVEACCIDMHHPFKLACYNKFPNAIVVVDKFHVIKLLNEAIKDLMKRILPDICPDYPQQKDFNKTSKWIILTANERLTDFQRTKLPQILALNQKLNTIYEFKEDFRKLYILQNVETARYQLQLWINNAKASDIPELIHVANTYSDWFTNILNYWHHGITNGITEGKVNKIKVFRRKAYHYNNFHALRYKVLKSEQFNFRK